MPNPRIMEGYTPGIDDDPNSYFEEAMIQQLGHTLPPISDNDDEGEDSTPEQITDEPAYFPTLEDEGAPVDPPVPREIVTSELEQCPPRDIVTSRAAPSQGRSGHHSSSRHRPQHHHREQNRGILDAGPQKSWALWMILGAIFTLLLVLVAIAAMVMAWAFIDN